MVVEIGIIHTLINLCQKIIFLVVDYLYSK
jgi:hypothetical protein